MKKAVLALAIIAAVFAVAAYVLSGAGPVIYTDARRTFIAQDPSINHFLERACFSNDCTRLLALHRKTSSGQDGRTAILWDIDAGKRICNTQLQLHGNQLAMSPDGRYFAVNEASGNDAYASVYEAGTGKAVAKLPTAPNAGIFEVEFTPDGETLVVLEHMTGSTAKVWNWREKKEIRSFACKGLDMAVSSDGKQIVSGRAAPHRGRVTNGNAYVWDIQTGKQLHELPGHEKGPRRFAFSPDGAIAAMGDSTSIVRVWDMASGALVHTWDAFPHENRPVTSILFSHSVKHLAVSYRFSRLQPPDTLLKKVLYQLQSFLSFGKIRHELISPVILYDCETWRPLRRYGLKLLSANISFLTGDAGLVTVDLRGSVRWWDLP